MSRSASIRCGRCATVCPCHLVPQMMAQAGERGDLDAFQALNGMECYECGTCTFVCPAKRRLTQTFKQCRQAVMALNRKKQAEAAAKKKEEEEKAKAGEAKAAESSSEKTDAAEKKPENESVSQENDKKSGKEDA